MKKIIAWALLLTVSFLAAFSIVRRVFPKKYHDEVSMAAVEFGIDEHLIYSVIKAESNFSKNAVSRKNAKGLMQLTEQTARWCADKLGIDDYNPFDEGTNIRLGTFYLSYLLEMYKDKTLAIAAYNAGHGNVDKWLSSPEYSANGKSLNKIPYRETRNYLKKVIFYEQVYNFIY